jgi:capsular exopolysaccharide family
MSRVDQAFRRAVGRIGDENVQDPTPDVTRVDEYPTEDRRVAPVVHKARSFAASLPASTSIRKRPQFASEVEGKVVIDAETSAASIEEYRRLATTLHLMQGSKGIRTLLVSSALPRDGKSLTSTNLALTLSETYRRRVLLIDADFRRPSLHEIFGLPNNGGLAESLRATGAVSLPLAQISNHLTVLPAGAPDHSPMAALTSERMRNVIADARNQFDWVILDTPPVGLISDANLLASLVDGVLLVVGAGSTPFEAVQRAVAQLGEERILGVVLNRVTEDLVKKSDYHDYYGHSGAEAERS